jgi:uncharacterized membrane protein
VGLEIMDKAREQAEKALHYLSTTDQEVVALERQYKDLEQAYKETKAAIIKTSAGKSEGIKKAEAETHPASREAWVKAQDAWQAWRNLYNRRESATRRWEDWRSLNSARAKGVTV